MPKQVCPTHPDPQGGDIIGCGHVFEAEPDDEGLLDCPECGIVFSPDDSVILQNSA